MTIRILVRGGGDLASGAILRCARAGWKVLVSELAQPVAVRRLVSFGQAIYDGSIAIEGTTAVKAVDLSGVESAHQSGFVPVMVDPDGKTTSHWNCDVVVDARMLKKNSIAGELPTLFTIGLGPGFYASQNCHAVVETVRGPFLGRVIWNGAAEDNTGIPDPVGQVVDERVLRSPTSGKVVAIKDIGDVLIKGDLIATVADMPVYAPFNGVLRGLIQSGLEVPQGMKIGDLDPRSDVRLCYLVSDKALAVGGGVIEVILSKFGAMALRRNGDDER